MVDVVVFTRGTVLYLLLQSSSIPFLVRTAAELSLLKFSPDPPQAASTIATAVSSANVFDRVLILLIPRWYLSCRWRKHHPQLFIAYSLLFGLKNPRHECIKCPQDLCLRLDQ
jgi:hypothetical protein